MTLMLLVRSLLIAFAGVVAIGFAHRRSAALRHWIAVGTLALMVALPWLATRLPTRTLPVLPPSLARRIATLPSATLPDPVATVTPGNGSLQLPPIARVVYWVWAIGCALLLARWLAAYAGIVQRSLRAYRTSLGDEVWSDPATTVPMTAWMGRHRILLPATWKGWPSSRLDHVLAHERAHIRRGDWFWQTLGQTACTMFWPNPLAWYLSRRLRDLAEEAADDLVLVSGAVPSHYAADLLEISREMRATHSAMALPMARKAEVARRIEMILNKTKRRGGVSLTTLLAGGASLLAICIPLASFGLGPVRNVGGFVAQLLHKGDTTSYAEDIANGLTTPAAQDDDYVGILKDGRKIRVLQVAMKRNGAIVAWEPDGTPLQPSQVVKHWMTGKDGEFRHILVEIESKAKPNDINGGLGSGPALEGEPSSLVFAGGGAFAGPRPGSAYIVSLIGVPKDDGDAASFTFGMSDGAFHIESAYDPAADKTSGIELQHPKLEVANPPFPWEKWNEKRPKPATRFTAKMASGIQSDLTIVAVLKNGKTESGDGDWGPGYDGDRRLALDYYFRTPKSQIRAIEIRKRESLHAEVLGVHLRPSNASAP